MCVWSVSDKFTILGFVVQCRGPSNFGLVSAVPQMEARQWNGGPAKKARMVYNDGPNESRSRGAGSRTRNQQSRADELLRAEQRAQDAEARAALSERRLRIMGLDLAHMKRTNKKLLRDYENAVGEKQSLKSENSKLQALVEKSKRPAKKSDSSSSASSTSDGSPRAG